jgi:signal transduction histidine kinase
MNSNGINGFVTRLWRRSDSAGPARSLRRNWRVTLKLGFSGLLILVALTGISAIGVLNQIQERNDDIRREFLFRSHLLNEIRSQLYLSGTYLRDYLLEQEQKDAEAHRNGLEKVRKSMEAALDAYRDQLTPNESAPYESLRGGLLSYWTMIHPVLSWDSAKRRELGYQFIRDEVLPRRMAMLEIADEIANLNEQQLDAGNASASLSFAQFRIRLIGLVCASLVLGLAMAVFSVRKILRLEDEMDIRYLEIAAARRELQNLSARLVQAQEHERRTISRELHDEVGQSLSAVLVEVRNLAVGGAAISREELRRHIDVIKELAEGSVRVVRNMALLLRPSMLDDLGLIPALKWQAREVSKQTPMEISVETELASDELPEEYKTCIYRVVQEALHNCSRHSSASTVRIELREQPDSIVVSVQDDGAGFDVKQSKGLGLVGMQERVTSLGGIFQVHSEPGVGTILRAELPATDDRTNRNGHEENTYHTGR